MLLNHNYFGSPLQKLYCACGSIILGLYPKSALLVRY